MTPTTADHPTGACDRAGRSSVKARLTPNRRRRSVENDEYASFIRRVMRAYTGRVATGDVDALADMTGLAADLDDAIIQAVTGLRIAGYSWAESPSVSVSPVRQPSNGGADRSNPLKRGTWADCSCGLCSSSST